MTELCVNAYLPDGTICHYDSRGRLIYVADAFGNVVTLTWDTGADDFGAGSLAVTQYLGSQTRTITLAVNNKLPVSMEFSGEHGCMTTSTRDRWRPS